MIWTLCLTTAYLCLTISLCLLLKAKFRKLDYVFLLTVMAGFLIYLPSYIHSGSMLNTILSNTINLLQIITINSNSFEELQSLIPDGTIFYHYLAVRGLIHILLPVLFACTAFSFFLRNLSGLRLRITLLGKKKIYVFSHSNEKTRIVLSDICKNDKDRRSAFIVLKDKYSIGNDSEILDSFSGDDLDARRITAVDRSKFRLLIRINKKRKQSITFFCIDDDSEANICTALELVRLYRSGANADYVHINIFSDRSDIDAELVDAGNDASMSIRIVNRYQLAAYKLLMDRPLYEAPNINEKKLLHILIIGCSKMSFEMLKAVTWCGQLTDVALKISVAVEEEWGEKFKEKIGLLCPELLEGHYDIEIFHEDIDSRSFYEHIADRCQNANYIALCREEDADNIRTAIQTRRLFYYADGRFEKKPFIAAFVNSGELNRIIDDLGGNELNYSLYPFGSEESIYSYEELIDSDIEYLAQNVHLAYLNMNGGETGEKTASDKCESRKSLLRSYYRHEYKRRSNVTAAIHLKYKLWEFGFVIDESQGGDDYLELKSAINSPIIEKVARTEHNRWMAFYRTEGWRTVSIDEASTEGYKTISRNGKSELMHMHPDICEYEEIRERSNLLGKTDTTVYDRKLIEMIPDILNDKWTAEKEKRQGWKIRRREINDTGRKE